MLCIAGRHQQMADNRDTGKGDLAQNFFPGGHHAPPEHLETLRGECLLERLLAGTGFTGKKDHANRQRLARRERKPGRGEQKFARNTGHDAHTVAALAVSGNGSAMSQAGQRGKRLGQDFMGRLVA